MTAYRCKMAEYQRSRQDLHSGVAADQFVLAVPVGECVSADAYWGSSMAMASGTSDANIDAPCEPPSTAKLTGVVAVGDRVFARHQKMLVEQVCRSLLHATHSWQVFGLRPA